MRRPQTMKNIRTLEPDSLWIAEMPFRFLGVEIGARMTIARLENGDLWLHSPIDLTPELRRELDALGPVRFIVAPNKYHYLSLHPYSRAYPNAQLWAAPGLMQGQKELHFAGELGDAPPPQWSDEIDQMIFEGSLMAREVVWFHRSSRTLIFTDLSINLRSKRPPLTRFLARLLDVRHLAPSRVYRLLMRDRKAARDSVRRILAWDFNRVIIAHGDIVERDGKRAIRRAFAWLRP